MKLYFRYAAMNSGKSSQLLQVAHNYEERNQRVLLIKPSVDTRTINTISSRIGISKECTLVDVTDDLYTLIRQKLTELHMDCVLIDECQFLSKSQIWQLSDVVDKLKIPVMCYGLRTDFKGNLFEGSAALMAIADDITEIRGICECGKKSNLVARMDSNGNAILDGDQVCIGAEERYISYCRPCWKRKTILQ